MTPDYPSVNVPHLAPPKPSIKVGGRLQHFWREWEAQGASPYIVNILKEGLKLEFVSKPPLSPTPIVMESYEGDAIRRLALKTALEDLITKGVLEEVRNTKSPGFYGRLFIRPKPNGKWRTIIDLSQLNLFIHNPSFQMESAISIQNAMRPGMIATSIDLSEAYFHVPVHRNYRKYMRIALFGRVLQFKAMPMGLNVSARIFTKIILEMLKMVRKKKVWIHAYLDDLILKNWHWNWELLKNQTWDTVVLTTKLGWLINFVKSELDPKWRMIYVGIFFQFDKGLALAPLEKVKELESMIKSLIAQKGGKARIWSKVIGKMGSMMRQITLGPLHRRTAQKILKTQWTQKRQDWEDWVPLPEDLVAELSWWLNRANTQRGVSLEPWKPTKTLFTDASKWGFGATLGKSMVWDQWSRAESQAHSNNLEMLATIRAVESLQDQLRGESLLICSDNTTTVATINKQGGVRSWELTELAWTLWTILDRIGCQARARHIPGRLNVLADSLSRQNQVVSTEWCLNQNVLEMVWRKWGVPEVDLFATSLNKKLPKYVSPFPDPMAWAINALTIPWNKGLLYAFPPWNMVGEVLMKLMEDQGEMILIAPTWTGRPWFPLLLELLVDQPVTLPRQSDLLFQPHTNCKHKNLSLLDLRAWRLSGDPFARRASVTEWRTE